MPWTQFAYQRNDITGIENDVLGLDPDISNPDSLLARAGLRLEAALSDAKLMGGIALAQELLGDTDVVIQGLRMKSAAAQTMVELSAGAEVKLQDRLAVFGEGAYVQGLDRTDDRSFKGQFGVRARW